jgi:hypothetical protein
VCEYERRDHIVELQGPIADGLDRPRIPPPAVAQVLAPLLGHVHRLLIGEIAADRSFTELRIRVGFESAGATE